MAQKLKGKKSYSQTENMEKKKMYKNKGGKENTRERERVRDQRKEKKKSN